LVDLSDVEGALAQEPREARAIGPGGLDAHRPDLAEALDPVGELCIARLVGGELTYLEQGSVIAEDRGVVGLFVRVNADHH
jgi:hypothetical protein